MSGESAIKISVQAAAGILLAGALIAFVTTDGIGASFFVVLVASVVVIGLGWLALTSGLSRAGARSQAETQKEQEEQDEVIFAVPLAEARAQVESLLADPDKFECIKAPPADPDVLESLAPGLRAFFTTYERVRILHGDTDLDRGSIGPSTLNARYLRIGSDVEHTELVVEPGEETVFEIDGSERSESEMQAYPSIYHSLLSLAQTIYP